MNLPRLNILINILHHSIQQIFIKTLTGRKQAFNFEPENQVLAVKQALQEKEGIQVDQIRLIFSGKQLSDDRSLESYSINAGATIHMVLQLRGGLASLLPSKGVTEAQLAPTIDLDLATKSVQQLVTSTLLKDQASSFLLSLLRSTTFPGKLNYTPGDIDCLLAKF
eukprot:scaffold135_cov160-Skeletonema_dohrnii-CCMP3373.AAC.8